MSKSILASGGSSEPISVLSDATERPWRRDPRASSRIVAGADDTVASVGNQPSLLGQWDANAALIVRAVNSYDALIEAVIELLATHPAAYREAGSIDNRTDNAVRIARAALAGAK